MTPLGWKHELPVLTPNPKGVDGLGVRFLTSYRFLSPLCPWGAGGWLAASGSACSRSRPLLGTQQLPPSPCSPLELRVDPAQPSSSGVAKPQAGRNPGVTALGAYLLGLFHKRQTDPLLGLNHRYWVSMEAVSQLHTQLLFLKADAQI